jgi:CRP/FNR family transcriptional regulator, nitrogen fixation regulation protein
MGSVINFKHRPRTYCAAYYRELLSKVPHPLENLDDLALITSFRRGQEIRGQGQPADWCFLINGAARRSTIRSDGRRQIVDLLLAGDCFGMASVDPPEDTIEAISQNTVVASYPGQRIEELMDTDPRTAHELRKIASEVLSRMQRQILILGRITATEKVGSFILEMAARVTKNDNAIILPISRYDIADYLGVSVETVSRAVSDLKQRGAICLQGPRTISIVRRRALEERGRNLG